jgi:hypothetical protein
MTHRRARARTAAVAACLAIAAALPASAAGPPSFTGRAAVDGEFLELDREVTVGVRDADRVRVKARAWEIGMDEDSVRHYYRSGRSRWHALQRVRGTTWSLNRRNRKLANALDGDLLRVDFKACNRSGCTRYRAWFGECLITAGEPCRRTSGPRPGLDFVN